MENNEVEKVVIDDVEYEVNGLSDKAKISVAQLKDLQNQINISRMNEGRGTDDILMFYFNNLFI